MNEKPQEYQELLNSLGLALVEGHGDYTRDRHEWLDQITLEEIFLAMRQAEADDPTQYEEIW